MTSTCANDCVYSGDAINQKHLTCQLINTKIPSSNQCFCAKTKTAHHVEVLVAELSSLQVDSRIVWLQSYAFLQDEKCSNILQYTTDTHLTVSAVYTE